MLASRSPHRAQVLERLGAPFETCDSEGRRNPCPRGKPGRRAQRLALAEAQAVAARWASPTPALVIGGDQVAHDGQNPLRKPRTLARARAQLLASRGQRITFESALAVVHSGTGAFAQGAAPVQVRFAKLSEAEIDAYLALEQPLDAAGALYSERLGAVLLEAWGGGRPLCAYWPTP